MESLPADPEPYAKAIRAFEAKSDYKSIFSAANLECYQATLRTPLVCWIVLTGWRLRVTSTLPRKVWRGS